MLNDDMGESQAKWVSYKPQKDEWVYNDGEPSEKAMSAFIFDYVNIKAGWGKVQAGASPEYLWREDLLKPDPKPSDEHKASRSVDLYFNDEHLKGVYSWTTNGWGPVTGINEVYEKVTNHPEKKDGLLPVIKYTGSEEKKFSVGSSRIPQFEIIKWVERPADWDAEPVVEAAPEPVVEESTDEIPF